MRNTKIIVFSSILNMRTRIPQAILVAMLMSTPVLHAQGNVIYFDNFDGDGSSDLIGTTPDTTTGGATWNNTAGSSGFLNDGSATDRGTGAWLPIAVESGNIYTLTIEDLAVNGQGSQWVSFGFSNTQPNGNHNGSHGSAWALYRPGTYTQFAGSGTNNMVANTGIIPGSSSDWMGDFRIVLDTTDTAWTITYSTKNVTDTTWDAGDQSGSFTYATNPTGISYVGIGNDAAQGDRDFGSFEVSVVPEPSAFAVVALTGFIAFIGLRRHRS